MKLNNKGFMMAEVVVVSAVVLLTLTTLYTSYNKIYSLYSTRLTYNDVTTLYRLAYYRDCLISDNELVNILNEHSTVNINNRLNSSDKICNGSECVENIFIVYNNATNINKDILNSFSVNQTYKDYVAYLSSSVDLTGTYYVMIMEKCDNNKENCKYAYLELDDSI